jgi:hypothetical protein
MHRFDDAKDFELAKDDGLLYAAWEANVVTSNIKECSSLSCYITSIRPYRKKKDPPKMR